MRFVEFHSLVFLQTGFFLSLQFFINGFLIKKDVFIAEFQPLVSYKRVSYKKKTVVKFQRGDL